MRQDEKSRPVTVEHIKQLRDRVEISIVEDLRSRLKHSKQEEANVEARLGARWAKAEEGRDNSQRELHRKLDEVLAIVVRPETA